MANGPGTTEPPHLSSSEQRLRGAARRAFLTAAVLSAMLLMAAALLRSTFRWGLVAMFGWSVLVCVYAFSVWWGLRSLRAATHEPEDLSMLDPLTGLPNRRGLMVELEKYDMDRQEMGRRVRLIDVDLVNLNKVNYEFGQSVGDAVLQDIANLLRTTVPEGNPVGRLGGDEFLVIMPHATQAEAEELGARIKQAISRYSLRLDDRAEVRAIKAHVSVAAYVPERASLHETVVSAKEATAHGKLPDAQGSETPPYYHVPRVTLGAFAAHRWQDLSKQEQEAFKIWKREFTAEVTERMTEDLIRLLDEKAETNWADFVTAVPAVGGSGAGRTYGARLLAQRVAKQLGIPYRDVMRSDASGPEMRTVEPAVDAVIDKGDGVLLISDVISSGILERRCVKKLSAAGAHVLVIAWAAY